MSLELVCLKFVGFDSLQKRMGGGVDKMIRKICALHRNIGAIPHQTK